MHFHYNMFIHSLNIKLHLRNSQIYFMQIIVAPRYYLIWRIHRWNYVWKSLPLLSLRRFQF